MVRKRNLSVDATTTMTEDSSILLPLEESETFEELRSSLAEINKIPGVKGYILRNSTTAVIDLQNTEKLVEYALLLSEATDYIQSISCLFNLKTTNAVVNGKELKMLCLVLGETNLGIFVDKNVDHADIFKRIS